MHAWQFMKALGLQRSHGWAPFVSMQNYYNLLYREDEREMLRLCLSEGVGTTPWSPLARGKLARSWTDEATTERARTDAFGRSLFARTVDIDKPIVDRTNEIAGERGVSPAQIALAWLLSKSAVTSPIVGATRPGHLEDAIAAVSLKLSGEEVARLEEAYQPHPATEGYS
jgi:aryl-alcohol dehydrogenase-like predicted oxidoreductase